MAPGSVQPSTRQVPGWSHTARAAASERDQGLRQRWRFRSTCSATSSRSASSNPTNRTANQPPRDHTVRAKPRTRTNRRLDARLARAPPEPQAHEAEQQARAEQRSAPAGALHGRIQRVGESAQQSTASGRAAGKPHRRDLVTRSRQQRVPDSLVSVREGQHRPGLQTGRFCSTETVPAAAGRVHGRSTCRPWRSPRRQRKNRLPPCGSSQYPPGRPQVRMRPSGAASKASVGVSRHAAGAAARAACSRSRVALATRRAASAKSSSDDA